MSKQKESEEDVEPATTISTHAKTHKSSHAEQTHAEDALTIIEKGTFAKLKPTAHEKALLLVASIRAALANGCQHFNKAGSLLRSEVEILKTLRDEGSVSIDESAHNAVTTPEAEYAAMQPGEYQTQAELEG
jgi:hypothetical protein